MPTQYSLFDQVDGKALSAQKRITTESISTD